MIQCPRCGIQTSELHSIPPDILARLSASGESNLPGQVCIGCISSFTKAAVTSGSGVLMAEERAREQHRLQLWKSRVSLIRKARHSMSQKNYSDAAVSYEKYLKILDIVFDVKKGEVLKPEQFKESARTTELTVVASVYWDLMRIYDTHERYADRMLTSAKQLAAFIPFTTIYPDIIRKAETFQKTARNPNIVKQFLKMSNKQTPRCFIATSAFESPCAPEVWTLRMFRDLYLRHTPWGRRFIIIYYRFSPFIANFLDKHPKLKPTIRAILRLLIKCVT